MKLSAKENWELIIFFILVFFILILMHGNDLGQFRNTDKADVKLEPVLYVICLAPILLFLRKGFNKFTLKLKVSTVVVSMVMGLSLKRYVTFCNPGLRPSMDSENLAYNVLAYQKKIFIFQKMISFYQKVIMVNGRL